MKEESKEQKGKEKKGQQKGGEDKGKYKPIIYTWDKIKELWDHGLQRRLLNRRVKIGKLKDGNYIVVLKTLVDPKHKDKKKRIQHISIPFRKETLDALFGIYFELRTERGTLIREARKTLEGFKKEISVFAKVGGGEGLKDEDTIGMVRIKYTKREEEKGEDNA